MKLEEIKEAVLSDDDIASISMVIKSRENAKVAIIVSMALRQTNDALKAAIELIPEKEEPKQTPYS